jgi:hypothetical protein
MTLKGTIWPSLHILSADEVLVLLGRESSLLQWLVWLGQG